MPAAATPGGGRRRTRASGAAGRERLLLLRRAVVERVADSFAALPRDRRSRWARHTPSRRRRCRPARVRDDRGCRRAWRRCPSSARTGFRPAPAARRACAPADTPAAPECRRPTARTSRPPTMSRPRIVAAPVVRVGLAHAIYSLRGATTDAGGGSAGTTRSMTMAAPVPGATRCNGSRRERLDALRRLERFDLEPQMAVRSPPRRRAPSASARGDSRAAAARRAASPKTAARPRRARRQATDRHCSRSRRSSTSRTIGLFRTSFLMAYSNASEDVLMCRAPSAAV